MTLLRQIGENLRDNMKLTMSFATATLFAITVICILIVWRDGAALIGVLVGTALGWAAGILLAPYKEEEKRFQKLSKGIAGFITGYAAGKFDRVFDLVTDKSGEHPMILDGHFLRIGTISFTCFLVAAVTVFVARAYWQATE